MSEPMVIAHDVHKQFGSLEVLKGVSFEVERGEVVCLIGPSGSGKSTLLRCVNHLEAPTSGWVSVDGEFVGYRRVGDRLHELPERQVCAYRADVGMVFQSFNLFPHMTALQNIVEGPIRVRGESTAVARDRARRLLDRVGLAHKADRHPKQLSGGEQQRVAIARALAMQPKVMLFDEPTSALDPELVGEVLTVLRDLAADGMTMMVATHEIAFAADVADAVIFMDQGAIVEHGTPQAVIGGSRNERTRRFLSNVRREAPAPTD
ncbi:amino acid ABC transporter ATP-binding protein [Microbacterium sp. RD1]|uniref:amino acid ABC transporter ATP-binding protein n=1 Tax=Microbacterium sp. RD1 TaxID=3457313 RepID=UPI003FA541E8